jgi:4-amino-4-deoxy-L-arabinose transferase-like glycosyltransferase
MLNKFLLLICVLVVAVGTIVVDFPDGAVAIGFVIALSVVAIMILRRFPEEKQFLTTVFLLALALRMAFGIFVHVYDLRSFFGGDALAYDANGQNLLNVWMGREQLKGALVFQDDPASGSAWGMNYLTAFIYLLLGRNIFAAQSLCAVFGAATSPMIYFCAKKIFNNLKVAKLSAIAIAVFPSFVIWSGQLLKDGLIIFLLVTTMTMVIQLQERLNYRALAMLIFSLAGILSLRFYIFYMVLIAVAGSFLVGSSSSNRSILRNTVVMVLLAFALIYLGIGRNALTEYEVFGNLQRVQSSRSDLARAADSGFQTDADVSTTEGALSAMPVGFGYLMFAPFPWQATNLRQAITIPEVLMWWAMIPFLIIGLIYAIRFRLRNAFPVLIFSLLLTLAYSIFQGNVGTAYRQRTQIQVFLFIFIGVGWTVYKEHRENERLIRAAVQKRVDDQLRGAARLSQNV